MDLEQSVLRGIISVGYLLMITGILRDRAILKLGDREHVGRFPALGTMPDEIESWNIYVMCSLIRGADNLKKKGSKLPSTTDFLISMACSASRTRSTGRG